MKKLGFDVQKTFLCKYNEDIVVACELFTDENSELVELADAATHPNVRIKLGRNILIDDVYEVFNRNPNLYTNECIEYFWDVFVVDAFLGNYDRHSGNIGFILDKDSNTMKPSPIYDCGSCLYPDIPDHELFNYLKDNHKELSDMSLYNPRSVYKDENNERVLYHEYIQYLKNEDLNKSLEKIFPTINFIEINNIIDSTPGISEVRKEFCKTVIQDRYENILEPAYNLLMERNNYLEVEL